MIRTSRCLWHHQGHHVFILNCFVGPALNLVVQGCGISFIYVHRFLLDVLQFVDSSYEAVHTSLLDHLEGEDCASVADCAQNSVEVSIHFRIVSVIIPETGWSSNMFVINTHLIEIQPRANGQVLKNEVQASLKELVPTQFFLLVI